VGDAEEAAVEEEPAVEEELEELRDEREAANQAAAPRTKARRKKSSMWQIGGKWVVRMRQQLKTAEDADEFCQELSSHIEEHRDRGKTMVFEDFDIAQNSIPFEQTETLFGLLCGSAVQVERLRCFGMPTLDDSGMIVLSGWLQQVTSETMPFELHLSDCAVTAVGFRALMEALAENATFPGLDPKMPSRGQLPLYLRLEGNYIDEAAMQESVDEGIAVTMTKSGGLGHSDTAKCRILLNKDKNGSFAQKEGEPPAPEDAPPPKRVSDHGKGKGAGGKGSKSGKGKGAVGSKPENGQGWKDKRRDSPWQKAADSWKSKDSWNSKDSWSRDSRSKDWSKDWSKDKDSSWSKDWKDDRRQGSGGKSSGKGSRQAPWQALPAPRTDEAERSRKWSDSSDSGGKSAGKSKGGSRPFTAFGGSERKRPAESYGDQEPPEKKARTQSSNGKASGKDGKGGKEKGAKGASKSEKGSGNTPIGAISKGSKDSSKGGGSSSKGGSKDKGASKDKGGSSKGGSKDKGGSSKGGSKDKGGSSKGGKDSSKGSSKGSSKDASKSKGKGKGESLPSNWEKHWSDQYKLHYYWNSKTGDSSWEKPKA